MSADRPQFARPDIDKISSDWKTARMASRRHHDSAYRTILALNEVDLFCAVDTSRSIISGKADLVIPLMYPHRRSRRRDYLIEAVTFNANRLGTNRAFEILSRLGLSKIVKKNKTVDSVIENRQMDGFSFYSTLSGHWGLRKVLKLEGEEYNYWRSTELDLRVISIHLAHIATKKGNVGNYEIVPNPVSDYPSNDLFYELFDELKLVD